MDVRLASDGNRASNFAEFGMCPALAKPKKGRLDEAALSLLGRKKSAESVTKRQLRFCGMGWLARSMPMAAAKYYTKVYLYIYLSVFLIATPVAQRNRCCNQKALPPSSFRSTCKLVSRTGIIEKNREGSPVRQSRAVHDQELARVAAGDVVDRDPLIVHSWQRCLSSYRLDPSSMRGAHIHTDSRLREHQDAMDSFLHVARVGVESLYRQVAGLGYVLLLTDAKGVTVDFIGDPAHYDDLRKVGLYGGADWNEVLSGTCGVGTCIATGKALTVHQSDHFDGHHIALTCTAAPVFAPDGNLAAVLDISAMRSPEPKLSQHLALQLVTSYAQKIENANLLNNFRNQWMLQLSRSQEFVDVDPEYWIAVDTGGRILGYNNAAKELISAEFALAERGTRLLLPAPTIATGPRFRDLFDADFSDLPNFTRERATAQRCIRLRTSGMTLFALAQRPPEAAAPSRVRQSVLGVQGPLAEVSGGDPGWTRSSDVLVVS